MLPDSAGHHDEPAREGQFEPGVPARPRERAQSEVHHDGGAVWRVQRAHAGVARRSRLDADAHGRRGHHGGQEVD
eukprot:1953716-Prorocentrum_lima.AAC.1